MNRLQFTYEYQGAQRGYGVFKDGAFVQGFSTKKEARAFIRQNNPNLHEQIRGNENLNDTDVVGSIHTNDKGQAFFSVTFVEKGGSAVLSLTIRLSEYDFTVHPSITPSTPAHLAAYARAYALVEELELEAFHQKNKS